MNIDRRTVERNIIGSILANPKEFARLRSVLPPELFQDPVCRKIAGAIVRCFESDLALDVVNVATVGKLAGDEAVCLTECAGMGGGDPALLAKKLTELALVDKFVNLRDFISKDRDPFEMIERSEVLLAEATALIGQHTRKDKLTLLTEYVEYLQRNAGAGVQRIPTPYPTLNRMLHGGLEYGGFSITGGSPGAGKTSFMLSLGLHAVQSGVKTSFLEGEMPPNELFERLNGIRTGLDINVIRQGKNFSAASREFISEMYKLPFEPVIISERTLSNLVDAVRTEIHDGSKLIFIDYLQVFAQKSGRTSEFEGIKIASETLRGLSLRHQVHICAASAFNRNESTQDRPTLNSLYGSSGLGHDATVAMIVYGEQNDVPELLTPLRNVVLGVVKNRGGARGTISLKYHLDSQRMEEVGPGPAKPAHTPAVDDVFSDNGESNAF